MWVQYYLYFVPWATVAVQTITVLSKLKDLKMFLLKILKKKSFKLSEKENWILNCPGKKSSIFRMSHFEWDVTKIHLYKMSRAFQMRHNYKHLQVLGCFDSHSLIQRHKPQNLPGLDIQNQGLPYLVLNFHFYLLLFTDVRVMIIWSDEEISQI